MQSLAWSEFWSEFCSDHGLSFVPRSEKHWGRGRRTSSEFAHKNDTSSSWTGVLDHRSVMTDATMSVQHLKPAAGQQCLIVATPIRVNLPSGGLKRRLAKTPPKSPSMSHGHACRCSSSLELRALQIAIADRHDFLSRTSPSLAKPQWGRFFSSNNPKQSQTIFHCTQKSQGFLVGGGGGVWTFLGPKIRCVLSPT